MPEAPPPAFGHEPILPPRMVRDHPRPADGLLARFEGATSGDVADLVGPLYVMSPGIAALAGPAPTVHGWALTAKAWPGDNLAVHGALTLAAPGAVLVVDWRGHTAGCGAGAQVLAHPMRQGLRAVVVDGAWRDRDGVHELGLPIFARGTNPFSPPKLRPGEINVPVSCGGVVVEPGDVIVADADGIAVVPLRHAAAVAGRLPGVRGPRRTPEEQAERAARRAEYFRWHFEQAGGETA